MRIHDSAQGDEEQVNLMPLIDMVFLLLIFFLVATTIAQDERPLDINLPVTGAPRAMSDPPEQLVINIRKDGTKLVNGKAVETEALRAMLAEVAKSKPKRDVLVRADLESIHRYFAEVASLCHEAGIPNLNIGYVYEKKDLN